ncbi:MAG: LytR/AlgR family response regulator transcription factor, partial [Oceanobacter sp.]
MTRVLIVDDEPLARQRLVRLMEAHPEFECVGEAADGASAVTFCQQQSVDLVLMDVEMPGMNGMDAARALGDLTPSPGIIFCTAYEQFAVEAFGVNAIDYLLKPVRSEDLARALSRVSDSSETSASEQQSGARTHITVRSYQGIQKIPVASIYYFQADQKYVNVVHEEGEHLIDESLRQLESEFGETFLR